MRTLVAFLTKNSFIFLFLLLEFVSFSLLVGNNNYQYSKFFNSSNFLVGNLYSTVSNINEYFNLKEINMDLARQNVALQNTNIKAFTRTYSNTVLIKDTSYFQRYFYTSAIVINNSVSKRENYITLDKGALNGIKAGMGVVSSSGVVGIVKNVSSHFCSVMSVLHQENKISAKIKRLGYYGTLLWSGEDYKYGVLKDIPNHVNLSIGDTVVTSGYSSIFPEGIGIGQLTGFNLLEGSNFYEIEVAFFNDYKKISQVHVVKSLYKQEQQELEQQQESEAL